MQALRASLTFCSAAKLKWSGVCRTRPLPQRLAAVGMLFVVPGLLLPAGCQWCQRGCDYSVALQPGWVCVVISCTTMQEGRRRRSSLDSWHCDDGGSSPISLL